MNLQYLKDPGTLAVLVLALLTAIIVISVIAVKKARKKADRRILEAFGKPPADVDYALDSIQLYYAACLANQREDNELDETTWNDLNMDDVFKRINTCASSVGEEYLYRELHDLDLQGDTLQKREKFVAWLEQHPESRMEIQRTLSGLGKHNHNGLVDYLFHAEAKQLKHSWVFIVMAALPLIGVLSIPFLSTFGIVFTIISVAANILVYVYYKLRLESELESMRYFSALLWAANKLREQGDAFLAAHCPGLKTALKPFRHLRGMLPGKAQQTIAELESITVFIKMIFLADLIRYNHVIHAMRKHAEELHLLYQIIGEMDLGVTILWFRKSLPYCCLPAFTDEGGITFSEMVHPLLTSPVPNSGSIRNDSIITGSNASGKSTFIKAVAVNSILAETLHTCCAQQFVMKHAYVATSMALRDDIISGESYFITEIKSLKRILAYCEGRYCMCFIDEILRGTNTAERIAASTAALKKMHGYEGICIVASHDIELTQILSDVYDNYHFSETIADGAVTFDYLLKAGPSKTTNAIKLLEYMGFEKSIIEDANKVLESRMDKG